MTLRIFIHNVGHGHAVHAFTPNGQSIVIDLGCSDNFSPLGCLRDITSTIDNLIITHPHGDHIDEILELDRLGFEVRQFWHPSWLTERDVRNANQSSYTEKLDRYFDMATYRFIGLVDSTNEVGHPDISDGVSVTKYFSHDCGTSNINNHSGVIVFEYLGVKVVVPGDNESPSWKALLEQANFVEAITGADVFMASHHGRESGYYSDLLKIINPRLCVVSDGRVQDTDATSRYSAHAREWLVHSESKGNSKRSCLTTRSDGYIDISIGSNEGVSPFLFVKIQ